jgi:short-subunit dehydrogenase
MRERLMGKNSNGAGHGIGTGARVIITGASSGMGKALAIKLAKDYQAKLVLNARSEGALNLTKDLVEAAGGEAAVVVGDVGSPDLPQKLVDAAFDRFGGIEILVNNAGFAKPGPMQNLTPKDWEDVFQVNFFAPLRLTYLVLPHFIEKKHGTIVNISSVAGKVAVPGSVSYCASKFALTGLSEGTAAEFADKGVNVITVCPGWVRTEFFEKNSVSSTRNPTSMAQKNDLSGLLMRHVLSISSEEAAGEIIAAVQKNKSSEIVLTLPAKAVERIQAIFPAVMANVSKLVPNHGGVEEAKAKAESN